MIRMFQAWELEVSLSWAVDIEDTTKDTTLLS